MAKYVFEILDGDRAGDILSVPDRPLRIGRKPTNDLVLADEKTSGVHAEVVVEGDRHVLRDLGSTNGTFLDGKRVTEVVLTAGDVVTVGRLRVKFRDADGGTADSDPGFSMHRLDASRVQKRGGLVPLLVLLLLVGGGAGAWFWWQGQPSNDGGGGPTPQKTRAAIDVTGNKLSAAVAGCETAEGWKLDAHGAAFVPGTRGNSGNGGFEAIRGEGNDAHAFAIATLAESIPVFSGRSIKLEAWVQTAGSARIGVRGVCSSSAEGSALRFRLGTRIDAADGAWQNVSAVFGVPPGCDRLDVELVAVLPDAEAAAYVDDVAVTESGSASAIDHKMEEGGQTIVGTGTALAVRSTELTLLGIAPGAVPPPLQPLHDAGLCVLSDLGATLTVTPAPRSVAVAATGVDSLQFLFPAESAGQSLARDSAAADFGAVAASSRTRAADLLLGNQLSRVMLHMASAVDCGGRVGGGVYRLVVAASEVELVFGFRAERQDALEMLRAARQADAEGAPGRALDRLADLMRKAPQDSEVLGQATVLRSEILGRLDDRIGNLAKALEDAEFFDTRGGFVRVVEEIDRIVAEHGENNMAGRDKAVQLRAAANSRLLAIDAARHDEERRRLEDLGNAFTETGLPGLARLVTEYSARQLGQGQ